jgi:hypothetical protein
MNKTIPVHILYTQGCPNLTPTIDLIERVASDIGTNLTIEQVLVTSQEEAVRHRCLGSPTIQINGVDIESGAGESMAFGLG